MPALHAADDGATSKIILEGEDKYERNKSIQHFAAFAWLLLSTHASSQLETRPWHVTGMPGSFFAIKPSRKRTERITTPDRHNVSSRGAAMRSRADHASAPACNRDDFHTRVSNLHETPTQC